MLMAPRLDVGRSPAVDFAKGFRLKVTRVLSERVTRNALCGHYAEGFRLAWLKKRPSIVAIGEATKPDWSIGTPYVIQRGFVILRDRRSSYLDRAWEQLARRSGDRCPAGLEIDCHNVRLTPSPSLRQQMLP